MRRGKTSGKKCNGTFRFVIFMLLIVSPLFCALLSVFHSKLGAIQRYDSLDYDVNRKFPHFNYGAHDYLVGPHDLLKNDVDNENRANDYARLKYSAHEFLHRGGHRPQSRSPSEPRSKSLYRLRRKRDVRFDSKCGYSMLRKQDKLSDIIIRMAKQCDKNPSSGNIMIFYLACDMSSSKKGKTHMCLTVRVLDGNGEEYKAVYNCRRSVRTCGEYIKRQLSIAHSVLDKSGINIGYKRDFRKEKLCSIARS